MRSRYIAIDIINMIIAKYKYNSRICAVLWFITPEFVLEFTTPRFVLCRSSQFQDLGCILQLRDFAVLEFPIPGFVLWFTIPGFGLEFPTPGFCPQPWVLSVAVPAWQRQLPGTVPVPCSCLQLIHSEFCPFCAPAPAPGAVPGRSQRGLVALGGH